MSSARGIGYGLLGSAGAIAVWAVLAEVAGGTALVGPLATWDAIVELMGESAFWSAAGTTLVMALRGLLIAAVVGTTLGILVGTSRWVAAGLQVPLAFLRSIPPIVVMPIALLVLGPTQQMGEALVFYGCVLPIVVTTAHGVAETDPVAIQTARSFGLSRFQVMRRVTLPSTSAYVGTAVRIALPHAFVIVVLAGFLAGSPGLGHSLVQAVLSGDSARLYAIVVVLGCMGLLVFEVGHVLERRLLHWHVSYRKVAA